MSNGRRYRRRARRHHDTQRVAALLAEAAAAEPRMVGAIGLASEAWMRGRVMFVIPALVEGLNPEQLNALERRRRATLEGTCDCGAVAGPPRRVAGKLTVPDLRHGHDCTASDAALAELGIQGARVTDAPDLVPFRCLACASRVETVPNARVLCGRIEHHVGGVRVPMEQVEPDDGDHDPEPDC